MDFAVLLTDDRVVIFKKNEGIVLNEAAVVAGIQPPPKEPKPPKPRKQKKNSETQPKKAPIPKQPPLKVLAAGDSARKLRDSDPTIILKRPLCDGRVVNPHLASSLFKTLFKKVNAAAARSCLVCTPCSLTPQELANYKAAVFGGGVSDVAFIPGVIVQASATPQLSIIIGDGGADIAIVAGNEILCGGTVDAGRSEAARQLQALIEKRHNTVITETAAKEVLGEVGTLLLNDDAEFTAEGFDIDTEEPRDITIKGDDCRKILQPLYDKISTAALQLLGDVDAETGDAVCTNGAIVGGSGSAIMGLREFLSASLKMPIILTPESRNSVILGAGALLVNDDLIRKIVKAN